MAARRSTVAKAGADGWNFGGSANILALSFSDTGEASGAVVFAGYGLVVPDTQNFGYDSYAGLDVKDKIVVVLRYFPEDADQKTRGILARYADLRYKAQAARQRGAKGMIVVTGPRSPNAGAVVPMTFDTAIAGSGLVAASISGDAAAPIFAAAGKQLEAVQKELDSGNPHVAGFAIPGLTVTLNANVIRQQQTGHNVVGYLPATTATTGVNKPWISVGAHYDHLGRGGAGNSLADKQEANEIHHGADDNASGTATVLAIGEALSKQPRKRQPAARLLVGRRARPDRVEPFRHQAAGPDRSDRGVPELRHGRPRQRQQAHRAGHRHERDLAEAARAGQRRGRLRSHAAGGSVSAHRRRQLQQRRACRLLTFFTGAHQEYHKPSDTADKINYEDLDRVGELAVAIVKRLMETADAPLFTKVEQKMDTGGRAGLRLFTGTIPDYATDVKGLLLGGVIGGGPAEQAGLAKGDVIIEIAGQSITNIYDYTYALELLKIGQPAKVVYMRGGEKRETTLTPAARK